MLLKYPLTQKKILLISDMHGPYHHPDSLAFLKKLHQKYQFDLVISMGDLVDWHSISFHPKHPNLAAPGHELEAIRKFVKALEKLFPSMIIIGSNHGDLPMRKVVDAGLPTDFLRPYNEIYQVGPKWKFVDELVLRDGEEIVYLAHGIHKNALKVATQRGVHHACGHYHTEFSIGYVSNPRNLLWGMNTGCLIDKDQLAFEYGKLTLDRPIIGTGVIINGQPKLEPMLLNHDGRWNGRLF